MSLLGRDAPQAPEPGESDAPDALEESPEHLPRKAWATIVLFAVFVVAASGCVVGHFLW